MAITTPKLTFEEYLKYDDSTDTRYKLDFLHKSKKEPHPAFDLRQSLPSPPAGRNWGWGVRGLLQEVYWSREN
ncbi:hypothetical protein [Nostoc sp. LPT]|uniref:hypothetical protein n=1 Tax=Nostoc sp. LPT TaxID=2815387 RepID=UPI001D5B5AC4|nr:hypothetical protein [Nostoc sp. LPT]MBN4003083.1 hypothetical protein [Nostoc sp. LPT]